VLKLIMLGVPSPLDAAVDLGPLGRGPSLPLDFTTALYKAAGAVVSRRKSALLVDASPRVRITVHLSSRVDDPSPILR